MTHTSDIDRWKKDVEEAEKEANEKLHGLALIKKFLTKLIDKEYSPFVGIEVKISHRGVNFSSGLIGKSSDSKKTMSEEPLIDDSAITATVSIDVYSKVNSISTTQWFGPIRRLLAALWLPAERQTKFGLFDYQDGVVKSRLRNSLSASNNGSHHSNNSDLYVVYFDLDGFKKINDQAGHDTGDTAIMDVCSAIEECAHDIELLAFIKGGDEFGLVIRAELSEVFSLMQKLRSSIITKTYGTEQNLKVDFTSGIANFADFANGLKIDAAFESAEESTKQADDSGAKQKKRGTINMHKNSTPLAQSTLNLERIIKLGISISWILRNNKRPFPNLFLNLISNKVSDLLNEKSLEIHAEIEKLLIWLGINRTPISHESDLIGAPIINSSISEAAIAIAIAHGILINSLTSGKKIDTLEVAYSESGESVCVMQGDSLIWGTNSDNLTRTRVAEIPALSESTETLSPCMALQIGFVDLPIAHQISNLFCDKVIVDDRPKSGGGLPDFWQATVAHVISVMACHPNTKSIFVFGDKDKAVETLKRLTGDIAINVDEVAAVAMLQHTEITHCVERLKNPAFVKYVADNDQFIDTLYKETFECENWLPARSSKESSSSPKMKRKLDDSDLVLRPIDGMRCSTAAQAYPLIVEILRTAEPVAITFDDASQQLSEIIGFKLALERPTDHTIPEYWLPQHEAFKEYANKVLINKDSLIGKYFYGVENQLELFLEQLTTYCDNTHRNKSTRRAILVVPNNIIDRTLRPLGLVSIWATPRFADGAINLEFCFVWRTVEVLVGLPYSLYGSIEFAQHIRSQVQDALQNKDVDVTVGGLTYLALSLHMRVDEFHQRIAKRIADAASA